MAWKYLVDAIRYPTPRVFWAAMTVLWTVAAIVVWFASGKS